MEVSLPVKAKVLRTWLGSSSDDGSEETQPLDCRALATGTRPMDPMLRSTATLSDLGGLLNCIRRYREEAVRIYGADVDHYYWCRSHPKKRFPQEQYDIDQWLIWIADHYADLDVTVTAQLTTADALTLEDERFEVYAADVLGSAWNPGEVTYRMYGLPMTDY